MSVDEAMAVVHTKGYGLGGHMVTGGPWKVTIYTLVDGLPVAELPAAPTWDDAVLAAATWVSKNHSSS